MIPSSYSFIRELTNCPHKAYRKFITRDLPKEDTDALREGERVHKMMEEAINNKRPLTAVPQRHWSFVTPLSKEGAQAEVKYGMTIDRQPADYWANPWFRGKVDVQVIHGDTAFVLDWKTGQRISEDPRELNCQAMLIQANHPHIQHFTGCYVWLAYNKVGTMHTLNPERCYYGTVAAMKGALLHESDNYWPKRENPLCPYCPVKDCEFNRAD